VTIIKCNDGKENTLIVQMIVDCDFPIDEIRIRVIDVVAMLPGEY
jgi:hypothetical protein